MKHWKDFVGGTALVILGVAVVYLALGLAPEHWQENYMFYLISGYNNSTRKDLTDELADKLRSCMIPELINDCIGSYKGTVERALKVDCMHSDTLMRFLCLTYEQESYLRVERGEAYLVMHDDTVAGDWQTIHVGKWTEIDPRELEKYEAWTIVPSDMKAYTTIKG